MGEQRHMDLDPRRLTTLAGYLEYRKREQEIRRGLREAGPKPFLGEVADAEKARRQIREMIDSANTDWDAIREQTWRDD
jgi:hypothetical protein